MAMALPVVATAAAVEGIEHGHGLDDWIADEPDAIVERVQRALAVDRAAHGAHARRFVLERYDWAVSAREIVSLLEGGSAP